MLGTILAWIGYVILGAGVLIGAVFGAAWYVAKEINAGHGKGCSCPACQARRQRQWRARHGQDDTVVIPRVNEPRTAGPSNTKRPSHDAWVSTDELRAGMTVLGGNGTIFKVQAVLTIAYGRMVVIVNPLTKTTSRIPVPAEKMQDRIWLTRRNKGVVE